MYRVFPAIALAILLASAASATTPTSVLNDADPTHHPYQVFASTTCTEAGDCSVTFPAITTSRTLILHASCSFALAAGTTFAFASMGIVSENPRNALQVFTNSTSNGFTDYGINADTYLFYVKGQQPQVEVFGNSPVQELSCTLSGYYY